MNDNLKDLKNPYNRNYSFHVIDSKFFLIFNIIESYCDQKLLFGI